MKGKNDEFGESVRFAEQLVQNVLRFVAVLFVAAVRLPVGWHLGTAAQIFPDSSDVTASTY